MKKKKIFIFLTIIFLSSIFTTLTFSTLVKADIKSEASITAIELDVLDEVIQSQRRWLLSPIWDNMGYPEEYYTYIVFRNGYRCTGTQVYYINQNFDGVYYWRDKATKYFYETW